MNCPHCNVTLVMTERSGVEIDYCPQCRGVWLDRGELDKIIERATALIPAAAPQPVAQGYAPQQPVYQQPPVPHQFGGHSGHGSHHDGHKADKHGYGQYKKKSMLSELFDF
jgi:Zn-finger nucleic acid-binding protein